MDRYDVMNNYTVVARNSIDEMRYGLDELARKIKLNIIKELENNGINYNRMGIAFDERLNDILNRLKYNINQGVINLKEMQYSEIFNYMNRELDIQSLKQKKENSDYDCNRQINTNINGIINETMSQFSTLIGKNSNILNKIYQMLNETVINEYIENNRQYDNKVNEKLEEYISFVLKELEKNDNEKKDEQQEVKNVHSFLDEEQQEAKLGTNVHSFLDEEEQEKMNTSNMSYDQLQENAMNILKNSLNQANNNSINESRNLRISDSQLNQVMDNIRKNLYERLEHNLISNRNEMYSMYKAKNMEEKIETVQSYENFYVDNVNDVISCIPDIVKYEFDKYMFETKNTNNIGMISALYNEVLNNMTKNFTPMKQLAKEQSDILLKKYIDVQKEKEEERKKSDKRKEQISELQELSSNLSEVRKNSFVEEDEQSKVR